MLPSDIKIACAVKLRPKRVLDRVSVFLFQTNVWSEIKVQICENYNLFQEFG